VNNNDKKKSLGRDPFDDEKEIPRSSSVKKLIKGRANQPSPKEVSLQVKLTPANLKHLDTVQSRLASKGRTDISRDELIRIAITLLTVDDVS
jgi:hypothetical protein